MMTKGAALIAGWMLSMASLSAAPARAGSGYKAIAKEVSRGAARQQRVAVLAFVPTDGSPKADGRNVSERLTTQLVRIGKVRMVERAMLDRLLEEQSLGRTGLIAPGSLKELGDMLAADAVLTGSFITVGNEVVINARLIDVQSGLILAACERSAPRDWLGSSLGTPPVPDEELAESPDFRAFPMSGAVADIDCANAAERADALERSILDLKARYWASRLRRGIPLSELRDNPGSSISDPELRRSLYQKLSDYFHGGDVRLTPSEVKRFITADEKAFRLHHDCGI